MPYGLIVVVGSIALTAVFVFVADAAFGWKALVVGLLALSFLWRHGWFLQAGLSIFLSLYFTYLKARS
jgi:hypothetical protein